MGGMVLSESDYAAAAKRLGCDVAAVKAVAEVESNGSGFLPDGQVKILFEPHVFSRLTGRKYDRSHPSISYPKWNPRGYGAGGQNQHNKLQLAVSLDRDAALQSASWGTFQVMGFNWKKCGYKDIQSFINDVSQSAAGQLRAAVGFILGSSLADELQRLDWDGFARGYNGPGYAENRYDDKLEKSYRKWSKS